MAASFIPRAAFPTQLNLPRSYYLGHHAAGLAKMRTLLAQIDLIVECRDYRVPLTSRNAMFEDSLGGSGVERCVVYTKKDLGTSGGKLEGEKMRHDVLRGWHAPTPVLFSDHKSKRDLSGLLGFLRRASKDRNALTGSHVMVVGMPNVGKSSLLNALRMAGVGKGKVAHTGAQPGVTRKIARSGVKIIDGEKEAGGGSDVYLLDTPGVFVPYVPDAETMLKLALCGSVKDTVVSPTTLADYLLFQVNLRDPVLYGEYCGPTNDIIELLEAVARKTGRLMKGGTPDVEACALWMVQRWRQGLLGRFVLDDVSEEGLERYREEEVGRGTSLNQARKAGKELVRARNKARRGSAAEDG
ncbi:hypothetical protein MBLNU230_g8047t1 [Neophaeotheca triangularis]